MQREPTAKLQSFVQSTGQTTIPQGQPCNHRAQDILPAFPETKHPLHDDGYPQVGRRSSDRHLRFNAPEVVHGLWMMLTLVWISFEVFGLHRPKMHQGSLRSPSGHMAFATTL